MLAFKIVLFSLFIVGQNFVGFVDFLKLLRGLFIAGVKVGVIFFNENPVRFFNIVRRGVFVNA